MYNKFFVKKELYIKNNFNKKYKDIFEYSKNRVKKNNIIKKNNKINKNTFFNNNYDSLLTNDYIARYNVKNVDKNSFHKKNYFNALYNYKINDFDKLKIIENNKYNFKNISKYVSEEKNVTKRENIIEKEEINSDIFVELEKTKNLDYDYIFEKIKEMIFEEMIFILNDN